MRDRSRDWDRITPESLRSGPAWLPDGATAASACRRAAFTPRSLGSTSETAVINSSHPFDQTLLKQEVNISRDDPDISREGKKKGSDDFGAVCVG